MLKQLLPPRFKKFLWNLFKAPQRKWVGYGTLWTDLRGYLATRFGKRRLQPVSVCIGVKNRSDNLLDYMVNSLNRCDNSELIELSVFDCGSSDHANLEEALRREWKGDLVYKRNDQSFARSEAFNAAVDQSAKDLILVCDADMSLPRDIVRKINRYVTSRSAWYPVVKFMNEDGSSRPYEESTGMFASRRQDFYKAGKLDESIREWGKEDWLLYFAFYKAKLACIRTNEPDFVHHFHPSLKPDDFVPLF